ncbi:RluA family pseudouridine synthase [bacterium]|nr:RluA family pseudouridine synthase [bacterium]
MNKRETLPPILYQDDHLLVINKPAGLLSIADGYDPDLPHLQTVLEPDFGPLWIVHRLDKDTSGTLVLARDAETHRMLNEMFRDREIQKTYHGLVSPVPDWRTQIVESSLEVNADRKHRSHAVPTGGKPAWSAFKVLKRFPETALIEIKIKTGITHQIRAHLRSLELALLGDTLYQAGLIPPWVNADRVMLHARELAFAHPVTAEDLAFTAPYPDDFREIYTHLRFTRGPDTWL